MKVTYKEYELVPLSRIKLGEVFQVNGHNCIRGMTSGDCETVTCWHLGTVRVVNYSPATKVLPLESELILSSKLGAMDES